MVKKKSRQKMNEKTDYDAIMAVISILALAYLVITNWTMIMVGGILTILLTLIIVAVAAYYILPAVGVTALTGLVAALATLIGASKRKG